MSSLKEPGGKQARNSPVRLAPRMQRRGEQPEPGRGDVSGSVRPPGGLLRAMLSEERSPNPLLQQNLRSPRTWCEGCGCRCSPGLQGGASHGCHGSRARHTSAFVKCCTFLRDEETRKGRFTPSPSCRGNQETTGPCHRGPPQHHSPDPPVSGVGAGGSGSGSVGVRASLGENSALFPPA